MDSKKSDHQQTIRCFFCVKLHQLQAAGSIGRNMHYNYKLAHNGPQCASNLTDWIEIGKIEFCVVKTKGIFGSLSFKINFILLEGRIPKTLYIIYTSQSKKISFKCPYNNNKFHESSQEIGKKAFKPHSLHFHPFSWFKVLMLVIERKKNNKKANTVEWR
jgi:hypothetical protein